MDESLLEIREIVGPGYQPIIDFKFWRVAVLNFLDEIHPERIDFMERHNETDEVFVLLKGQCILLLGEGLASVEKIQSKVMESGKIYNVKRTVWHSVLLSRDGSVLIVENRNTSRKNSNYFTLDHDQRNRILSIARSGIADWS